MFTKKYAPKSSKEIIGQDSAISKLRSGIENSKSMLVHGPTGVGKTSSVYAIAKELNYEVVEVNSSDFRTKDKIQNIIGNAVKQQSLFSKCKIILIDDIDGLSGRSDRGGVQAIQAVLPESSFPIIITSNDPWGSKFNTLRRKCEMVEFPTLNYLSIKNQLKIICEKESIGYEEELLKSIARQSGGDMRSAINDLQNLSILYNEVKDVEDLSSRDKKESILNALRIIFKSSDANTAVQAFNNVDSDLKECYMWIDENLPKEYEGQDLAKAYDYLSKADVFYGRIRRWQYWRYLVYFNTLITAGVAVSKTEKRPGFISYKRSSRILKMWQAKMRNSKKKAIAEKIALKCHVSNKKAYKDILPYIRIMIKKYPAISTEFNFSDEEKDWLSI